MPKRKKSADMVDVEPGKVVAIFDPAGTFRLTVPAPSGKVYEIASRVAFEIDGEDVDWFFGGWNRQYRQHLSRLVDYKPRQPQFDNGAAQQAATVPADAPASPQFDNGAAQQAAVAEKAVEPQPVEEPEPVVWAPGVTDEEEVREPYSDGLLAVDDTDTNGEAVEEDKE